MEEFSLCWPRLVYCLKTGEPLANLTPGSFLRAARRGRQEAGPLAPAQKRGRARAYVGWVTPLTPPPLIPERRPGHFRPRRLSHAPVILMPARRSEPRSVGLWRPGSSTRASCGLGRKRKGWHCHFLVIMASPPHGSRQSSIARL